MAISPLVLDKAYVNSLSELVSESNSLVSYARISTIGADFLEFVPGRNDNELPKLLYGTQLKINIYNPRLGFKVFSGMVSGSDNTRLKVGSLEVLADSERRQFLRVNVGVEAELTHTYSSEGAPLYKKCVAARIEDISLSGLGFTTHASFQVGDRVTAHFTLLDFIMNLDCTVKRIVTREDSGSIHYGCFYTRVSSSQEETLHKLLLKLQQARRARSL